MGADGHILKRGKTWTLVIELPRRSVRGRLPTWRDSLPAQDAEKKTSRAAPAPFDTGRNPFPAETTVSTYVHSWLAGHATQVRPRTIQRYRALLERHVLSRIGDHQLAHLTPSDVRSLWLAMTTDDGLAPATVHQARAALSKAMNDAIADGVIERNPVTPTKAPKARRPNLAIVKPDHVQALLKTIRNTPWEVPIAMAAFTGMRRSEVAGLSWSCVDLTAGTITIERTLHVRPTHTDDEPWYEFQPPKSAAGHRTIRLAPTLVDLLRRHYTDQTQRRLSLGDAWHDLDLVIERGDGAPRHPDNMTKAFKRYAKKARLPERARLHDLRHAAAIMLRLEAVPIVAVAEMLGHSSPAFTTSVYEHVVSEMTEAAAQAMERRYGN